MDKQEQDSKQKLVYRLVYRAIDFLELVDIKLLLLDHDFVVTDEELNSLVEQVRGEKRSRKVKRVNDNLLSYRASTLLSAAKQRAVSKGIEFDLDKDWVVEKLERGVCEATNLEFKLTEYISGDEVGNAYAPSIDRRDNSRGYTKDNSQLVLIAYNKFKSDYNEQTVLDIAKALVERAIHAPIEIE